MAIEDQESGYTLVVVTTITHALFNGLFSGCCRELLDDIDGNVAAASAIRARRFLCHCVALSGDFFLGL